jgi:hypothetical protein
MHSIIIAIIFYAIGFWLMTNENKKKAHYRNTWSFLSAILSIPAGLAITFM